MDQSEKCLMPWGKNRQKEAKLNRTEIKSFLA